jgi:hypothetical protein
MTRRSPSIVVKLAPPKLAQPPLPLGKVGKALWHDIVILYEFGDRASYETLYQACAAADRAEACRAQIEKDGLTIETKGVVRDHPLIKHELAARSFCTRSLARLGLDLEPVGKVGRPGGAVFA